MITDNKTREITEDTKRATIIEYMVSLVNNVDNLAQELKKSSLIN